MAEIVSADGRWLFVRTEEAGTPWAVHELDADGTRTGRWLYASSEDIARDLTASGVATRQLDRDARAAARPRCAWVSYWTKTRCARPAGLDGHCDIPAHAQAATP
jgi:hypothetical protein